MRIMYDAVTPANIPPSAQLVAGYVDGAYRWKPSDWARFPHAVHVGIATQAATNDGQVLDVERYDAIPEEAPAWVLMRRRGGIDPSVYCQGSTWPQVRRLFVDAKVVEPHYWVASWPGGGDVVPLDAVAHQYLHLPGYDVSAVVAYWAGVDPAPVPPPRPPAPPNPKGPPTTMAKTALPTGANPVKATFPVWSPDGSQLDLFLLGADGHIYEYWWEVTPGVWTGPLLIDGPG
jgi:hypothetical protein